VTDDPSVSTCGRCLGGICVAPRAYGPRRLSGCSVGARLVDPISQQLDAGAFRREHPKKIFGGYGVGDACSGCGDRMRPGQGVFEFETAGRTYRWHIGCFGLWEGESIRPGAVQASVAASWNLFVPMRGLVPHIAATGSRATRTPVTPHEHIAPGRRSLARRARAGDVAILGPRNLIVAPRRFVAEAREPRGRGYRLALRAACDARADATRPR